MIFYIYLLTEIYRNGYYIRWDRESVDNAMDDLHLTEGLIEQAMAFLVSRSLLMKRTLADSDTVITSPGIQKRYQEAIKSRKRDVYVDADIWLLDENETAPFIKVTGNGDKSCGNEGKSCGNWSKSCGNGIKESKVKESKENNIAPSGEAQGTETLEAFYESIWQLYPIKKGKGQVSKAKKKNSSGSGSSISKDAWRGLLRIWSLPGGNGNIGCMGVLFLTPGMWTTWMRTGLLEALGMA